MSNRACGELLEALAGGSQLPFTEPVVIVAAHPDDEVIGLGAQLPRLRNVVLVHVTDGSPRDLSDARRAGFSCGQDYAEARREECCAALRLVGIDPGCAVAFQIRDQEAVLHLPEIVWRLRALFEQVRPRVVITHPYEGGHPDHDAVSCAVRRACAGLADAPCVVEMTSYHQGEHGIAIGEFLPGGERVYTLVLSPDQVRLKARLFACYRTQSAVLAAFPIGAESFRAAPVYDDLAAPHPGPLYYESLGFGMTGERFRGLLRAGLARISP